MWKESNIQKQTLGDILDDLATRGIVIKHRFSKRNDPNIEYNRIYYLLNWSKVEAKRLVNYYFDNTSENNAKVVEQQQQKEADEQQREREREKSLPDQINEIRASLYDATINKKVKTMSEEEWRELLASFEIGLRKLDLLSVKNGIKYSHHEPSEATIHHTLDAVNSALDKKYSFLDALIKYSADEKIGGEGIYRYSTLSEIMDKTGLLDKYADEIH